MTISASCLERSLGAGAVAAEAFWACAQAGMNEPAHSTDSVTDSARKCVGRQIELWRKGGKTVVNMSAVGLRTGVKNFRPHFAQLDTLNMTLS